LALVLSPCAGEAELSDPAVTGHFAAEMAKTAAETHVPPWCGYIARRGGVPVGFGGFTGPPDAQGLVEIGYLTFPMHEGTGVAREVAAAMLEIARGEGVPAVIAHTLCEPNASTRVLERNGFVRDGFGDDPDEGQVWRWKAAL
jgi:RimJ/RimL family protein N-acetyltransferase